jgi:hypothetical protein
MIKKHICLTFLSLFALYTLKAQNSSASGSKMKGTTHGSSSNKTKTSGFGHSSGTMGKNSGASHSSFKGGFQSSGKGASTSKNGLGSSGKASSGSGGGKSMAGTHTYPGVGKSKVTKSKNAGTKYSFPGIHNARHDLDKSKK